MEESGLIERLMAFGLTRQEAQIYLVLVKNKELTGYEAAKETGISRSNVYSALAGLADKGAAYVLEGSAVRYTAVAVEEFCDNAMHKLQLDADYLKKHMPHQQNNMEGYMTIQGYRHIRDRIDHMIEKCEKRLYIAASRDFIKQLETVLGKAVLKGIKVVIISDGADKPEGAIFYLTDTEDGQIRLITDSSFVLTGEVTGSKEDTCLYSGQENLVTVFKEALRNKIKLIEIEESKKGTER